MSPPDAAYYAALDALIHPIAAARLPETLEPMRALLAALGHPERACPVVAVAGSTGKGTAALRLAAGLAAGGMRVGLYTSPHLHSFRERFAILTPYPLSGSERGSMLRDTLPSPSGRGEKGWITPSAFTAQARAVDEAARAAGLTPSTFERATALALRWFAGQRVELAVCEIGLGGRFDAVNAAPNVLALIGPIEREHAVMLGGTLEHIAWHKAGIIAPGGVAVVLPPADPQVRAVIEAEAAQQSAALVFADDVAAVGLAVLRERGIAPPGAAIPEGIALPGRLERAEVYGRRVLIDGGHTPLAAQRLAEAVAPELAGGVCVVVGMLADKDAAAYLRELDAPGVRFIATTAPADRALPAAQLAGTYALQHAPITVEPSFERALAAGMAAEAELTVVAGSLRMAAAAREALGLLDAAALDEARRTRALFEGEGYRRRWQG